MSNHTQIIPPTCLNISERKHCEPFLETADEGNWSTAGRAEHKVEYTEAYNLFLERFESRISGNFYKRSLARSILKQRSFSKIINKHVGPPNVQPFRNLRCTEFLYDFCVKIKSDHVRFSQKIQTIARCLIRHTIRRACSVACLADNTRPKVSARQRHRSTHLAKRKDTFSG